jgi:hypothetical protein
MFEYDRCDQCFPANSSFFIKLDYVRIKLTVLVQDELQYICRMSLSMYILKLKPLTLAKVVVVMLVSRQRTAGQSWIRYSCVTAL